MRVLPIVVLLAACSKTTTETDETETDTGPYYEPGCITVDGDGGYALLTDAISLAKDGSVIALCAGTYTGSIELDKSLTFTGAGADTTTWEADINEPVIKVGEGKTLTISGVNFVSTLSGILATGGAVSVSDSRFADMGNYAVRASDADVTISGVTVSNAQYGGIRISGGTLDLSSSEITGCISSGVTVEDGAAATLTENIITSIVPETGDDVLDGWGVIAAGAAHADLSMNQFGGNQFGDVLAQEAATVTLNGDMLTGSLFGMWLEAGGAELHDVILTDYVQYGIIARTTLPLVLENTIIRTTPEGSAAQTAPYSDSTAFSGSFGIVASGADVTMTGGEISGNNGGGFYQDTGAGTDVSLVANGTIIDNNARWGMVTFSGTMDLTDVVVSNTRDDDATCYDESYNIICNIALAAWNSDLTMVGGEVKNNGTFGMAPIFKSGDIDGTLITENSGYGVFVYAAAVNMTNMLFDRNGDYALNMNQGATAFVSGSTFQNGSSIQRSEYTDATTGDVTTYVSYYQGHDAFLYGSTLIVEDSHFVNGEQGILSYSGSTTEITNSDFTGYKNQPVYTYDSDLVLERVKFTDIGNAPVYCYLSDISLNRVSIDGVSSYPYKWENYLNGELAYSYEYEFSGTALYAQRCQASLENLTINNFESGGLRTYDSVLEMDGVTVSSYTGGYGSDGAIDIQYSQTNADLVMANVTVTDVTAGYGLRVQGGTDYDYDGIANSTDTDCDGDGTENGSDTDDQNDCSGGFVQASGITLSNIGIADPDTGAITGGTGLYLYQLDRVLFEGLSITGTADDGIYAYSVSGDFVGNDGTLSGAIASPGGNGVNVYGGTVTFRDLTVTEPTESGFLLTSGTSTLSGNTVTGATEYGAECVASPTFTGCEDNAFDGVLGETTGCGCDAAPVE
jgi:hypothetical protein